MRSRLGDRPFGIAPRVPNHLTLYELSALGPPDQAAARFEQWAEQIVADWSANRPPASRFGVTMPVLDETEIARPGPLFKVRRKLGIRSRLAHAGRYRSDYRNRLSAFQEAGCVILNPAGEFWISATDIPMRHLLDIYVAKKLGCLTAIVNHTFELVEPSLLQVVKHVYSAMDVISVREESSKARLTSLGIDPDLITVAPDVVFMTEPAPSDAHPASGRARVAICPNTAYLDQAEDVWSDLIQALLDREYDLTLVTNDFPTDRPALDRLRERFGLPQGARKCPPRHMQAFSAPLMQW
ncbi:polysaccharide pyruvyl transferase family protein [Sphingomonas piscis]|uniref:Polysaccharide pyruvyl transferase family protein n=1 Tax=Sphingomonas piscis TaxID=2714943 RepID=A0A6G7YR97_9SPHN|nr:polysaccharide pyruvyl transferase family protein [Sphingomonas piscis]QIK79263.1 polysaccharide pyruvyl transferase family protein [Sphingomonas piscis]